VPTVYENREFVAAGGLASYGGAITDSYRLAGVYTARFSPSMTAKAAWNSSTFVPCCTGSSPSFSGLLNIDRDSTMPKFKCDWPGCQETTEQEKIIGHTAVTIPT